jgi:hypothetical protein
MKITTPAMLLLVAVMFFGWSLSAARQPQPFPFAPPAPAPIVDRPLVRFVARAAKSLLWIMAFAEEKPVIKQQRAVDTEGTLAKSHPDEAQGADKKIDWSEGW